MHFITKHVSVHNLCMYIKLDMRYYTVCFRTSFTQKTYFLCLNKRSTYIESFVKLWRYLSNRGNTKTQYNLKQHFFTNPSEIMQISSAVVIYTTFVSNRFTKYHPIIKNHHNFLYTVRRVSK